MVCCVPGRYRDGMTRRYLMCRPTYFAVDYVINPWMDPSTPGEGDLLLTERFLLAGTGFRTDLDAHSQAQELFGRPVITLQLVDPRFYHLDTALTVLGGPAGVAYLPEAFSAGSQKVLRQLFPDAVIAREEDAAVLGLNAVSDGRRVVMPVQAGGLAAQLTERGYEPIGIDLSELRKAGGGPKCCTLEVRG